MEKKKEIKKQHQSVLLSHSIYISYTFKTAYKESSFSYHPAWLCPRPISNSQLHVLPHFHLCPIYLVVFKGSY